MRKLWVKAWLTLDGVFDADTMDHWWLEASCAAPELNTLPPGTTDGRNCAGFGHKRCGYERSFPS